MQQAWKLRAKLAMGDGMAGAGDGRWVGKSLTRWLQAKNICPFMPARNPLQIEIFTDHPGWRWRMWRSGHIVAEGPTHYIKRAQCRRTLIHLMAVICKASYVWKNGSERAEIRHHG